MNQKIPKQHFIFPSILLIIYLLIRLFDEAKLIFHFPIDYVNDFAVHMAYLFFLTQCGFHNMCSYWYNGYILFELYPPGWFFFTYPILLLTNNIQLATYISLVLMFILGFIFIYVFGKTQKLSLPKILFFFAVFFANPINIGNFIRLGRVTSLLSWVLYFPIVTIIFYYKDKELKKYFWLLPVLFACIIITHLPEAILAFFVLFSLFLIKPKKTEKIKIIFIAITSLLISSFWLKSFLLNSSKQTTLGWVPTRELLQFTGQWMWTSLATFIVIPAFMILFLFYWKSKQKSKKELLFHLPVLGLSILVLTRLIVFIPILNNIYPDEYMLFFTFFSLLFLFKTDYNIKLHKYIKWGLILFSIILIVISLSKTSFFPDKTQLGEDVRSLVPEINGKFAMIHSDNNQAKIAFHGAIYSYAAIVYNKTTSIGYSWTDVSMDYYGGISSMVGYIKSSECGKFKAQCEKFNTTNIITFTNYCQTLENCGFQKIASNQEESACLYKVN